MVLRLPRHETAQRENVGREITWLIGSTSLITIYIAAWALSPLASPNSSSDLDVCFWPSVETAANGHPLLIYSGEGMYGQCPNANGPLGLLPLLPVALVANLAGWANNLSIRFGFSAAVGAGLAVGMAAVALALVLRGRGVVEWRLATWCVFLLAPVLWISISAYGHIEQPLETLFVLLAAVLVLKERWALAGLAVGLAVLSRTTALLPLIPLVLIPLSGRHIKPAVTMLAATVATVAIGLAPFVIADSSHTVYSLATYRGQLGISGGSLWLVAYNTAWAPLVEHGDAYVILSVVAALSAAALWLRRLQPPTVASVAGLIAIAFTCFAMLAKTVLPYYLFEPYVFGAVWWLARPGSAMTWRLAVPLLLTADAFLGKAAVNLPLTGAGLIEGIVSSLLLAFVAALVFADLARGGRRCSGTTRTSPPATRPTPNDAASLLS